MACFPILLKDERSLFSDSDISVRFIDPVMSSFVKCFDVNVDMISIATVLAPNFELIKSLFAFVL